MFHNIIDSVGGFMSLDFTIIYKLNKTVENLSGY